jgi:hypothetical protein
MYCPLSPCTLATPADSAQHNSASAASNHTTMLKKIMVIQQIQEREKNFL